MTQFRRITDIIADHWKMVILLMILFIGGSLGLTFIHPFEYQSSARILVVPVQEETYDPFTAEKASERLGNTFGQIITTSSFQEKVLASSAQDLKNNKFSQDPLKKRKQWRDKISTQLERETGVLTINVYDADPKYAQRLLEWIVYSLNSDSGEYHGGGDKVWVVTVDFPVTSESPVRPNIILNLTLGVLSALAAIALFITWYYFRPEYLPAAVGEQGSMGETVGLGAEPEPVAAESVVAAVKAGEGLEQIADLEVAPASAPASVDSDYNTPVENSQENYGQHQAQFNDDYYAQAIQQLKQKQV
ncbi:MAG: hypothetical protein A3F54_05630 [Candidatus Kerfeldbacteria bacterium RIFCSPHIGHO2_12_FULL_48_17]|uniref:Polysaccharide chain length determinant N-terminal domain-containing protein n=1 Tax=Candidatus Kerfeldbacteria bacterium RIFCSPHIGHO2_12_FULL_48_17 TaxID=1798542 RepID=A0A1G2B5T3_9BACT|nr:MAG: hypothetical protein A3F54_05630 [Candidatus Kerfeldbacteria bacterium RIFCSPHIGHO2_12_FULL_48_17]